MAVCVDQAQSHISARRVKHGVCPMRSYAGFVLDRSESLRFLGGILEERSIKRDKVAGCRFPRSFLTTKTKVMTTSYLYHTQVAAMSSCNVLPLKCETSPRRTRLCAIESSCNAKYSKAALSFSLSTTCEMQSSCNAMGSKGSVLRRQYSGLAARQLWTRIIASGPLS